MQGRNPYVASQEEEEEEEEDDDLMEDALVSDEMEPVTSSIMASSENVV